MTALYARLFQTCSVASLTPRSWPDNRPMFRDHVLSILSRCPTAQAIRVTLHVAIGRASRSWAGEGLSSHADGRRDEVGCSSTGTRTLSAAYATDGESGQRDFANRQRRRIATRWSRMILQITSNRKRLKNGRSRLSVLTECPSLSRPCSLEGSGVLLLAEFVSSM